MKRQILTNPDQQLIREDSWRLVSIRGEGFGSVTEQGRDLPAVAVAGSLEAKVAAMLRVAWRRG